MDDSASESGRKSKRGRPRKSDEAKTDYVVIDEEEKIVLDMIRAKKRIRKHIKLRDRILAISASTRDLKMKSLLDMVSTYRYNHLSQLFDILGHELQEEELYHNDKAIVNQQLPIVLIEAEHEDTEEDEDEIVFALPKTPHASPSR